MTILSPPEADRLASGGSRFPVPPPGINEYSTLAVFISSGHTDEVEEAAKKAKVDLLASLRRRGIVYIGLPRTIKKRSLRLEYPNGVYVFAYCWGKASLLDIVAKGG